MTQEQMAFVVWGAIACYFSYGFGRIRGIKTAKSVWFGVGK